MFDVPVMIRFLSNDCVLTLDLNVPELCLCVGCYKFSLRYRKTDNSCRLLTRVFNSLEFTSLEKLEGDKYDS